jgi:hypothetical protein
VQRTAIVLFAYDRPEALERTISSLHIAQEEWRNERGVSGHMPLIVSLDGPRATPESRARVAAVHALVKRRLPEAYIHSEAKNRGLPTLILNTLNPLFSEQAFHRAICIEDDVEVAPTLLLALEEISNAMQHKHGAEVGHVVSAAPMHRDGSLEHQALLLERSAHQVAAAMLREYIERFELDGEARDGAYGARDHAAITAWSTGLAARENLPTPTGTSQDRMREFAWRRAGVMMRGTPMRLVRHRGLWGQHNTPWYALRTGQLFQRLDRRRWGLIEPHLLIR